MKVMITGAGGQLGRDLDRAFSCSGDCLVFPLGRREMDITDQPRVMKIVSEIKPDVIIHSAADTNVDGCELNPEKAYRVNALGTRNVAAAAAGVGARLAYISTDYVFDGGSRKPYTEFDPVNPINVYGKSKLAGEMFTSRLTWKYFIIRTSWLYGKHGSNFVKTMIRASGEKKEISVVDDQVGSPTYAKDLALFVKNLVSTELYGTYHASNLGRCSWFDFAREIFKAAGISAGVRPIKTPDLNRPAPRPLFSVMDNLCIRLERLPGLRPWDEALRDFLKNEFQLGLKECL